jgi:hypothetical protein
VALAGLLGTGARPHSTKSRAANGFVALADADEILTEHLLDLLGD